MKQLKTTALIAVLITACACAARAQKGEATINFNYTYGLPVGNFKNNIVSNGSPRGGSAAVLFHLSNKLALGGELGFQDYYQKYPRDLYKTGSNEVTSAVLSNSVQTVPLVAKIMWSPAGGGVFPVQPYISGGAGIGFVSFTQYLGEFGSKDNSVSFAGQAGAGVLIPFGKLSASGLQLGADFNYIPYNRYGSGSLNTVALKAGIYFP